jgi:Icc-related predicted phosphoesterase
MKLLTLSDVEISFIYSPMIRERFKSIDLIISCGDLPYYYLEYIISTLNKPLYYVIGNHSNTVEETVAGPRSSPWGAINLNHSAHNYNGLLLAGIEGSLRYNLGKGQYTQGEMWAWVLSLAPALLINKLRYGRYLDVFVTHAPPAGIHDMDDLPHRGIRAFRWLIHVFKPRYHFHGHIHVYRPDSVTETLLGTTRIINTYGFRETTLN